MEMTSVGNPLLRQMTSEHVSQVLDLASKRDERQYDIRRRSQMNEFSEGKANRAYSFAGFVIVILLVCLVLWLFRDQPELLAPILTGIGGLVSGFMAGWGFGTRRK